MTAAKSGYSSTVSSLPPPPCPKSPPEYPDLYGKRRAIAKVQILEREIGFLEEEVKSVEGLQPASRCCQAVTDFVVTNSDPLIPSNRENGSSCRFWKWLCGTLCLNFSWICCCCYSGRTLHLELPRGSDCNLCECCSCAGCPDPKWQCCACSCPSSQCCKGIKSTRSCCCNFKFPSCPDCSCCRWTCCCPKCPKVRRCSSCTKTCCNPCLFF